MTALPRAAVALLLVAPALAAQDARLSSRLDKPTLVAVTAIIDSARVAKLPTGPLYDKALEGSAKGSDGAKIVTAVRALSGRMSLARHALGTSASPDEIKAASTALDAGVASTTLAKLRAASGKRPVTTQLTVLADLVGRNVPVPTASDLVVQMARAGVKDPELVLFQRNVRSDIEHGAEPTVAAQTRARGLLLRGSGGAKPAE